MSEAAKWYVIHTYSGYENKVAQNIEKVVENRKLHDLIPEVRIPMETVTEIKGEKTVEAEKKLFPSYVLVKMVLTDDSWYIVRNTRGVTGFVGPGSKPMPLSDREVEALGVDTGTQTVRTDIAVGDDVTMVGGSFDGMSGTVSALDLENAAADVTVSMFGRETSVTLPLTQLRKED